MGSSIVVDLGDERIISVTGNVDFSNSAELSEVLLRAIGDGRRVVVDLSRVGMLDSSAVACLLTAYGMARDSGLEFALAAASDNVARILYMSGCGGIFALAPVMWQSAPATGDTAVLRRQDWRITESVILAEQELIIPLRDLAVEAAREAEMDEESVADIQLALTEALANAFEHGSPEPGRSKIKLRCLTCGCAFVAEVTDEGSGVDAEILAGTREMAAGNSLGLKLMQRAMDEVEFTRSEQGNCVRLLKWIGRK